MTLPDFEINVATNAADCQRVKAVLNEVWQMPSGVDVLELSTLVAYVHTGCYVALAHSPRSGEDIAASVGFFGPSSTTLHSHITGVSPRWAGRGIGRAMKMHQCRWCIQRGVEQITWTFDPLVVRNAFFNLDTIGARATAYLPDHYGPMSDGLNAGQGSDRMLMTWNLRAAGRATQDKRFWDRTGAPGTSRHSTRQRHIALTARADLPGEPDVHPPPGCTEVEIAIPGDIEGLRRSDPAAARRWREATRAAFVPLLDNGWHVAAIERPGRYILTANDEQAR
ncbi:MAG: hypothetical protein WA991_15325 [Ornithinimicrobium sp.]